MKAWAHVPTVGVDECEMRCIDRWRDYQVIDTDRGSAVPFLHHRLTMTEAGIAWLHTHAIFMCNHARQRSPPLTLTTFLGTVS